MNSLTRSGSYSLPHIPRAATGWPRVSDRQIIHGVVYRIRTGISWRDLPERYGSW
ncbi:transposase [Streptomyces sp. NPDC001714]|uniref:transposase n=1 Tax=Streptomyces sp. NPDC001714 TaxID=3364603 RepID=UPI0036AF336C